MHKRELTQIVQSVILPHGFARGKNAWMRKKPDCLQIFEIQKSSWSNDHYCNLGIYFDKLGAESAPACRHCHIQVRIDSLFRWNALKTEIGDAEYAEHIIEQFDSAMNLDSPLEEANRSSIIKYCVESFAIRFFDSYAAEDSIRHAIVVDGLRNLAVTLPAQNLLGITI